MAFRDGEPVEPSDSAKAAVDVLWNRELGNCPGACFRPVGLAVDGEGRVFMTSDSTGEIFVVRQGEGHSGAGIGSGGGGGGQNKGGRTVVSVLGLVVLGVLGWVVLI